MKTKFYSSASGRGTTNLLVLAAVLGSLAMAAAGTAASPSELLEQGIYAEETKGDLDAAVSLYQQAVAGAKPGWAAAAQAQFRLGACYYKKKDSAAAISAFEQVLQDYSDQKEIVAQATDYLFRANGLLPAPWEDGEELRFVLRRGDCPKLGSLTLTANAGETNGEKCWFLGLQASDVIQSELVDQLQTDLATLRPIHDHYRKRQGGELEVETTYRPGGADVRVNRVTEVRKVELRGAMYDEMAELIRRLPLSADYRRTLMCLGLNDVTGDRSPEPHHLRVAGIESVRVPAGTYECFKVDLGTNGTTWDGAFWYSTDAHRYPVKLVFKIDGSQPSFTFELAAINRHPAGEPARYQDPALGFSLTAPPGWFFDRYSGPEAAAAIKLCQELGVLTPDTVQFFDLVMDNPRTEAAVSLLDPNLGSRCYAVAGRWEGLGEKPKQSPRAWAEEDLDRMSKVVPGLRSHLGDWQELTVAGHPAVSVGIGVFVVGSPDEHTLWCVWTFDGPTTVKFYCLVPARDFGKMRPTFDALVRSYSRSQ